MSEVTLILNQIEDGDTSAADRLLPLIYQELRALAVERMSLERPDHTLQATALVHEAYVRLVDGKDIDQWQSRGHFFTAAANAMRRILIESARAKNSQKRGGNWNRIDIGDVSLSVDGQAVESLVDVDDALTILEQEDLDAAELVKLRLYAGLSVEEAGKVLNIPRSTAYENWAYARSWFAVYFADTKSE